MTPLKTMTPPPAQDAPCGPSWEAETSAWETETSAWEIETPGLMEGIRARREARRARDVSLGELLWAGTGLLLLALTAVSLR